MLLVRYEDKPRQGRRNEVASADGLGGRLLHEFDTADQSADPLSHRGREGEKLGWRRSIPSLGAAWRRLTPLNAAWRWELFLRPVWREGCPPPDIRDGDGLTMGKGAGNEGGYFAYSRLFPLIFAWLGGRENCEDGGWRMEDCRKDDKNANVQPGRFAFARICSHLLAFVGGAV